jgi:hypothetical protein
MSNLTAQSPRQYLVKPQITMDYPLDATKVYEGSALSDKGSISSLSGVSPFSGTNIVHTLVAGEAFVGFANATVDNTGGTSGGTTISVVTDGIVKLVVVGLLADSLGQWVYASDGNTFTVELQEYTNNAVVGRVCQILDSTHALVHFQGVGFRSI